LQYASRADVYHVVWLDFSLRTTTSLTLKMTNTRFHATVVHQTAESGW